MLAPRRFIVLFAPLVVLAAGAATADVAQSVRDAMARFESRCPAALATPAAYLEELEAMPVPDRIAANSPDGQILNISDATLPLMEFAEIAVAGDTQSRWCSVALLEEDALASETALDLAFQAFLADRPDIQAVGGQVTATEAALAPHHGTDNDLSLIVPIYTYYLTGLTPADGTIVKVSIQGGSFEIEARRILRREDM